MKSFESGVDSGQQDLRQPHELELGSSEADSAVVLSHSRTDPNFHSLFRDLNKELRSAPDETARSAIRAQHMRLAAELNFDTQVLAVWIYDYFDEQDPAGKQDSTRPWRNEFQEQIKSKECEPFLQMVGRGREELARRGKCEAEKHKRNLCIEAIKALWGIKVVVEYDWFNQSMSFLNSTRKIAKRQPWDVACRIFNRILLWRLNETWEQEIYLGTSAQPIKAKDHTMFLNGTKDRSGCERSAEWFADDANWREARHASMGDDDNFAKYGIDSSEITRLGLQFDDCNLVVLKWNGAFRPILTAAEPRLTTTNEEVEAQETARNLMLLSVGDGSLDVTTTAADPQDDGSQDDGSEDDGSEDDGSEDDGSEDDDSHVGGFQQGHSQDNDARDDVSDQSSAQQAQSTFSQARSGAVVPTATVTTERRAAGLSRKRGPHVLEDPESALQQESSQRRMPKKGLLKSISGPTSSLSKPLPGQLSSGRKDVVSRQSNVAPAEASVRPTNKTQVYINWSAAVVVMKSKRQRIEEKIRKILEVELPDQTTTVTLNVGFRK